MAWSQITSTEIDAYKPVTLRLIGKYSGNLEACRVMIVPGVSASAVTIIAGTFTSALTYRLYIPDCMIGTGGVLLTFWCGVSGAGTSPPSVIPQMRVSFDGGAYTSSTLTNSSGLLTVAVTSATAGVYDVAFVGKTNGGGDHETYVSVSYGYMELVP